MRIVPQAWNQSDRYLLALSAGVAEPARASALGNRATQAVACQPLDGATPLAAPRVRPNQRMR